MPTILRVGNLRIAIFTRNEREPPHVHVEHPDGALVVKLVEETRSALLSFVKTSTHCLPPGRESIVPTSEKRPRLAEIRAAQQRSERRARSEPRAERVSYDEKRDLIVLDLRGGAIVALPVKAIHELADARPSVLKRVRSGFGGESITLEELDVDISITGLLADLIGITSAAAVLGRKGGRVKSEGEDCGRSGKWQHGGRPRKAPQPA